MNLLEKFGTSLDALCTQHPFGPLRAYCEAFHASLDSFDSDEIDGVLQRYPTLLNQLSSLQKEFPIHE